MVRVVERKRESWMVENLYLGHSIFGKTIYVDSGSGASNNTGLDPTSPVATLAQAIALATASQGDVIVIAPGHAETLTTALAISVIGLKIVGLGRGTDRPQFTINGNVDLFDITAANVEIHNILFNEGTNAHTARINVGAADVFIKNCQFDCGANDAETITIEDAADRLKIEECTFIITANGPVAGIEIEAAGVTDLIVRNCWFQGGSDTNAWDTGGINSAVAHTGCLIENNTFLFGPGVIFSSTALGIIRLNTFGEGTLASMLDPGSCMNFENYEGDAVDQTGRIFPTTAAS